MRRSGHAVLLAALLLPAPASAQEPWLFTIEADFAAPISEPQIQLFGPGAAASVAVHHALTDWFLLGARLRAGFLADGPPPPNVTLADPGIADFFTLSLAARVRPFSP